MTFAPYKSEIVSRHEHSLVNTTQIQSCLHISVKWTVIMHYKAFFLSGHYHAHNNEVAHVPHETRVTAIFVTGSGFILSFFFRNWN